MKKRYNIILGICMFLALQSYSQAPPPYACIEVEGEIVEDVISPTCIETVDGVATFISNGTSVTLQSGQSIVLNNGTLITAGINQDFLTAINTQLGGYEIVGMEPTVDVINNEWKVGQYDKLEIGMSLPQSIDDQINDFLADNTGGLNPFNPEDIRIVMESSCTLSGPIPIVFAGKNREAFYYHEYVQDPVTDTWTDLNTPYDWRIRMAPEYIGDYTFRILVYVDESLIWTSTNYSFESTSSSNKGPLMVTTTGTESDRYLKYKKTESDFFAIGHNIAHTRRKSSISGAYYGAEAANEHLGWLDELADAGGNFFRLEISPMNFLPDWQDYQNYAAVDNHDAPGVPPGTGVSRLAHMQEMDRLLDKCEERNLYFTAFRHHTEMTEGGDYDWQQWEHNPYRRDMGMLRRNYFENTFAIKWQKNNLRYMLSRWGYSPKWVSYGYSEVDNWLLHGGFGSEALANFSAGRGVFARNEAFGVFVNWFVSQKDYIKNELNYDNLLFLNTFADYDEYETVLLINHSLFEESDIVGFHNYLNDKNANYNQRHHAYDHLWNKFKKPVLGEEVDVSTGIYCCTDLEFHNNIWATSMMGGAGNGMAWWWDRGLHLMGYQKHYKPLMQFFKYVNPSMQKFKPQKNADQGGNSSSEVSARKTENFTLVSEDKKRAIGWAHNATAYWRNLADELPCIQELVEDDKLDPPSYPQCDTEDGTSSSFIALDLDPDNIVYGNSGLKDNYTDNGGVQSLIGYGVPIHNLLNNEVYKVFIYRTWGENLELFSVQNISSSSGTLILPSPDITGDTDYAYKIVWDDDPYNICHYDPNVQCGPMGEKNIKNERTEQKTIEIFPNPNSGKFTLQLDNIEAATQIEIYNLMGKKIYENNLSRKSTELDLSNQPKGVYLIKVQSGEKQFTKRVVIQ